MTIDYTSPWNVRYWAQDYAQEAMEICISGGWWPAGSLVVDCIYWNRQLAAWYTRYEQGNPAGLITVPSHMVLKSGLALAKGADVAPAAPAHPPKRAKKTPTLNESKRRLAAGGALVVPAAVHDEILEEIDRRDLFGARRVQDESTVGRAS